MSFSSHKDIIALWDKIADFGEDIGVSEHAAGQMNKRNSIGADYWFAVVEAAERRGFEGVNVELLLKLRPARKGAGKPFKPESDAADQTPARMASG